MTTERVLPMLEDRAEASMADTATLESVKNDQAFLSFEQSFSMEFTPTEGSGRIVGSRGQPEAVFLVRREIFLMEATQAESPTFPLLSC